MSVDLEGGCRVSEMREGEPLTNGSLRLWNRIGCTTGAEAISLRVMEFAPGISPMIRNEDCDQILYVLNNGHDTGGRGIKLFINECSFEVAADSGIYVRPGKTFGVFNPGPDPVTIISSQCPDPDGEPVRSEFRLQPGDRMNAELRTVDPIV